MKLHIPEVLTILPSCAPQIIHEVNPITWFERIMREGHEYKLARLQIQAQSEKDQEALNIELARLNAQKEAYLASIDNERRLIAEANQPTMRALEAFFKDLDQVNSQLDVILNKILDQAGEMEGEFYDRLISMHASIFSRRTEIYKNIQQTLKHSRSNIKEQLTAISAKISYQKALQEKD